MDRFTRAYLECALWAALDDDGRPLAGTVADFTASAVAAAEADCLDFQAHLADIIKGREEQAGQDFFLTRNRHGAGFWDGDWPEAAGRLLTESAHVYGTQDVIVTEEGLQLS